MENFSLEKHPKISTGFKVPDDYFNTLTTDVLKRISQKPTVVPLYKRSEILLLAAAILILAIGIPLYFIVDQKSTEPDTTTIENYIAYEADISQDEIAGLLTDKDLEMMDNDIPIENKTIEEVLITNNNFENYLLD